MSAAITDDCPRCGQLRAENDALRRQVVELRSDVARMQRHLEVPAPTASQPATDPLISKNRTHG